MINPSSYFAIIVVVFIIIDKNGTFIFSFNNNTLQELIKQHLQWER